jgi:hypothetical protein
VFDAAASMNSRQLTSLAYHTRIALEHWYTPEDLRKHPLFAGTSAELSPQEQEIVCQWLAEIEKKENRPIDQLDRETIRRYTGELSGMALRRAEEERGPIDPERAQRLLEELRRAVPWPPQLRKAS